MADDKKEKASKEPLEVITPPNKLKQLIGNAKLSDDKTVAKAEAAQKAAVAKVDLAIEAKPMVEMLRERFAWLDDPDMSEERALGEIFGIAHDLRGMSANFGYPLLSRVCASLSRFTDGRKAANFKEQEVVKAHVDAITAVVTNRISGSGGKVGAEIAEGLEAAVTAVGGNPE